MYPRGMPQPQDPDSELVERAKAGDLDAFSDLVRRHHARVAGLCASLLGPSEADDAAQEVFLKAHRALRQFHGEARFSTWLYRVAANVCLDARRKAARRPAVSLDALVEAQGEAVGRLFAEPARGLSEEDADLARRVLAALPEGYREVLVLRESQGLSYEELAGALGCSLDAVKARLKRARRELHEKLRHFLPSGGVSEPEGIGRPHEPR